jgi:hypothetical protein
LFGLESQNHSELSSGLRIGILTPWGHAELAQYPIQLRRDERSHPDSDGRSNETGSVLGVLWETDPDIVSEEELEALARLLGSDLDRLLDGGDAPGIRNEN